MENFDKKELVSKIATLANLEFNEQETERLSTQFEKIVYYIGKIEELDLNDIEPVSQITDKFNAFREDIARPSVPTKDALLNSPSKNDYFFKVPKVLE